MTAPIYKNLFESKTNNAHLITFEDKRDYVVKFYKPSENKALINEWFGYCIARFMGLPVPYSAITDLSESFFETIPQNEDLQYTSKQFASVYIPDSVNGHQAEVKSIVNTSDLAKIIVFDYWLCNTDRTKKNIILQEKSPGNYILNVIDHAEIFGSYSWTAEDLQQLPHTLLKSATHQMMASFIKEEEVFWKEIERVQTIPTQLLEEIFAFIPPDWNLSSDDQLEIINVLNTRRHKILPEVIRKFIKTIYRPLHP
ncbi:HipA family kinase [Metabacillus hrfriensis]|uniref:Uncharacterized protein n=1 Tax=Metabacillus hrfriensis TaxID=3048891 RepID=A0ACD4RF63_9BACI|nr:HipA family kinase [Metabacillus sp. CT-WN-B3]WHZ59137.1 hypothetical protein QLQ22_07350 [Metabacillus sp. CT-WN-B3]